MNPLIFILFVPFVFLTMTHNCTKETLKEYTIVEERKRKAGLFETRLLKNTAVTFSTIIHYKIYRVWSDEAAGNIWEPAAVVSGGFSDSLQINIFNKIGKPLDSSGIHCGGFPEVLCFRVLSVYLLAIHNQGHLAMEYYTG